MSAYVSANYNLVLESANQLFPCSNTNGQGYSNTINTEKKSYSLRYFVAGHVQGGW